ncbi:transcription factor TGA4-like [Heracleum sosnowskyi]|uniref:Transcription factor TGA4-like n=1 Tax=Heracleum sosnowskyi TaxID=360622 RepID=A0AAD8M6V2_9APIA|nr:transcription factor TGA4-like [Heracleum sosnowskyi]
MNSSHSHYISARDMGVYEPINQLSMFADFDDNSWPNTSPSLLVEVDTKLDNQSEDTSHETAGDSIKYDETNKRVDKVLRRLAQNREAARKSRLRKKAYVQQLESSRLKLMQLEQELDRSRNQGTYIGGAIDSGPPGCSGAMNPGIASFTLEYGNWVEKQDRQIANAAKADVFYLMSGMWKTSAERFLLWIGGFRPSELLKVLLPHLDLLEKQCSEVYNLIQSCQQAEDAISQGMDKLQQLLVDAVAAGLLGGGSYIPQVANAVEKVRPLVSFIDQADHIRQETLQQMYRTLTTRQAARGLLALGEYFQRLRSLSSLWATRHREPA